MPDTKLITRIAKRCGLTHGDESKLWRTLAATAFRTRNGGAPSDEQMMSLLIVANEHNLNPFTRELFAFEDKHRGVVPVVSVDGWARIINEHPAFDGMEFETHEDGEWCECIMYRKDRSHPIRVREYLAECMQPTGPWKSHPRRMLRHKAMIQCARVAFSFAGIYDEDEAKRVVASVEAEVVGAPAEPETLPHIDGSALLAILEKNQEQFASGERTADDIVAMLETRYSLSDGDLERIDTFVADLAPIDAEPEAGEEEAA